LLLFKLYLKADVLLLSNTAIRLIYPLLVVRRVFGLQHHSESAFGLSGSPLSLDLLRRAVLPRARHFMTSRFIGSKSGYERYVVTHPFCNSQNFVPEVARPVEQRSGALFVGRLEPEKGIRWLLDRWPRVRSRLGVQSLRIVGSGSIARELEEIADSRSLSDVCFVGPLSGPETAREMGRAAYILVPSLWEEPFGMVALEGVAAGAIAVLSGRGGLPEAAGDLGFYFDPDDEDEFDRALADARQLLETHLTSPALRNSYEDSVREHLAKFRTQRAVDAILSEMS
jgi:glycosyltransferase involved in cell wall biosynthesis